MFPSSVSRAAAGILAAALFMAPAAAGAGGRIELVDDVGATVFLATPARRVVCLSPGAVEIIYELKQEGKLTAACSLCDYPKAARDLPKVGDFISVSLESILAADPDLVVATGGIQRDLVLKLWKIGVPVVVLYPHSVDGVMDNIRLLGAALGCEGRSRRLVKRLRDRILAVQSRMGKITGPERPLVYFEISPDPLMAVGGLGYVNDLISLAGGVNVARGSGEEYPRISSEYLVNADPEVIILSYTSDPADALATVRARPGWENVRAVKGGRVHADLDMDTILRPGPRLTTGLEQLAERFHPPK